MSHATALSSKICVSKSMMYNYLYSDELAMVMEALVPTLQLSYLRLLQKILHDHCLPSLLRITQMVIFNNDDFATTINHPFLFHSTLPSQMENYFQILSKPFQHVNNSFEMCVHLDHHMNNINIS